jgi:hypothetical protein
MKTGNETGGTLTQTGTGVSLIRTIPFASLDAPALGTNGVGSVAEGDRSQHRKMPTAVAISSVLSVMTQQEA